jgi:hypothetical protein
MLERGPRFERSSRSSSCRECSLGGAERRTRRRILRARRRTSERRSWRGRGAAKRCTRRRWRVPTRRSFRSAERRTRRLPHSEPVAGANGHSILE